MSGSDKIPLNLTEKARVRRWWANASPRLTHSELSVLVELLDRQNPKTGLCCPSQMRLSKDTGFAIRTVKEAITCLVERGAIEKTRVPGKRTNRYYFGPVPETTPVPQGRSEGSTLQSKDALRGAVDSTLKVQNDASIKTKKKNKRRSVTSNGYETNEKTPYSSIEATQAQREWEVESELRKRMERQGINYALLVTAPNGLLLDGIKKVAVGDLTMNALAALLVEFFRPSDA